MITEALIQANIKDCLTYIHIVFFASYIQSSLVFIVRGSFRPKPFEAPRVNVVLIVIEAQFIYGVPQCPSFGRPLVRTLNFFVTTHPATEWMRPNEYRSTARQGKKVYHFAKKGKKVYVKIAHHTYSQPTTSLVVEVYLSRGETPRTPPCLRRPSGGPRGA